MIQSGCVLALVASIIYSFTESQAFTIDAVDIYWAFFFSLLWPDSFASHVASVAPKEGQTEQRRGT